MNSLPWSINWSLHLMFFKKVIISLQKHVNVLRIKCQTKSVNWYPEKHMICLLNELRHTCRSEPSRFHPSIRHSWSRSPSKLHTRGWGDTSYLFYANLSRTEIWVLKYFQDSGTSSNLMSMVIFCSGTSSVLLVIFFL